LKVFAVTPLKKSSLQQEARATTLQAEVADAARIMQNLDMAWSTCSQQLTKAEAELEQLRRRTLPDSLPEPSEVRLLLCMPHVRLQPSLLLCL
jgi:hypothetical protein